MRRNRLYATPEISIHAPRAGSDMRRNRLYATPEISIHAPRAGSDQREGVVGIERWVFQSTLPVRGATMTHSCRFEEG